MKVLILNGSPRSKGNTRVLIEGLTGHLLKQGHTVEVLTLNKMKLSPCLACEGCSKNGGHCVRPDDTDAAIQKVADADAVIFATPVYFWGVTAQLKMMVDKFYSRTCQFKQMHKQVGLLAVGGADVSDPQYELIEKQFACIADYFHWNLSFTLRFSAYEAGEVLKQPDMDQKLEEACRTLA